MSKNITLAHFNVRSLVPKFHDLKEHVLKANYDLFFITETWLTRNVPSENISIENYNLIRRDRPLGRAGGVCVFIKNDITYSIIQTCDSYEQLWLNIKLNRQSYAVGVVYKPPDYNCNNFFTAFEQEISNLIPKYDEMFCLGDFNIDMLKPDGLATKNFFSLLDTFNLKQMVNTPTRITLTSASLIDLIISSNPDVIKGVNVIPLNHLSDHDLIMCELFVARIAKKAIYKTIRDFKHFSHENFLIDLMSSPLEEIFLNNDINGKVTQLNTILINLFNAHAPTITIRITKNYSPWLTDNIRLLMKLRDKAHIRWRKSKNKAHFNYYKMLKNYTTQACRKEKKAYLDQKMRTGGINNIWKDLDVLDIRKKRVEVPAHLSGVQDINNYYINGIPQVEIDQTTLNFYKNNIKGNVCPFSFREVSEDEVEKIIFGIKSNAMGSDGLNLKFILYCCPFIIRTLTHIVNFCLQNGVFPDCWKNAIVNPIPKTNCPMDFKDLRPISVLPTLSKVLEKAVVIQIREHMEKNSILPETQSGFRALHSCETALLNLTDDILRGFDKNKITVLVLIDFSKAFDTLNHEMLCAILKYYGFCDNVLKFFSSYLARRSQVVKINDQLSDPLVISSGVPQGSIVGPLLYTLYSSELVKAVKHCSVHFYADDTQLQHSFNIADAKQAVTYINTDLHELATAANNLALNINAQKTSVLVFGHQKMRNLVLPQINIKINDHSISVTESAKNLGLTYDTALRFKLHVSNCIRSAYFNLKMIFNNRQYLSKKSKTILCESLVLSRFNFCDSVYGPCIDYADKRRIQVVQNSCLRLIFGIRKGQRISHKLLDVNWLNMQNRRLLHSACVFHKIIVNKVPAYLYRKITFRTDVHNLNIRSKGNLTPPLHRTESYKRSFTYQIAHIYNNIPTSIKVKNVTQFKSALKIKLLREQNPLHIP